MKSIILSLNNLLSTYREVAKAEKGFRQSISKLNEVLPQTDSAQMRAIVTTMEELESSRKKLADNLDRNVKNEVIGLFHGSDSQSCKTMKESKKSLDKIAGTKFIFRNEKQGLEP